MPERKFIKKVTAQKCPVHKAILEECGRQLVDVGFFSKERVIEKLGYAAIEDSIRWDYIADFLTDKSGDFGITLVPLAQSFFKTPKGEREKTEIPSLGRFIAGGHGKKTAGYASVSIDGGRFAVKRAHDFKRLSNGQLEAWKVYVERCLETLQNAPMELAHDSVTLLENIKSQAA